MPGQEAESALPSSALNHPSGSGDLQSSGRISILRAVCNRPAHIMQRWILATLLILGCTCVQAQPPELENPQLVASIRDFLQQRSNEARLRMFRELNNAIYLVPLQPLPGESRFTTLSIDLPRVGRCMPAFSDHAQVREAGLATDNLLDMPAVELWSMFDDLKLDCVLVNPATDPLPLRKVLIDQIRQQD